MKKHKTVLMGIGLSILIGIILFGSVIGLTIGKRHSSAPQSNELANPASVNCEKVGGTLAIQTLENGAQYGLCNFEDNMSCEEWALYRGECPVGGVKTTGYDNIGQMYCAWLGGQTLAVPDSQCTLPSGTVCPTNELYAGTCPSYNN